MAETARDVMVTEFLTLHPENTIAQAVQLFKKANEAGRTRVFGLVVTDAQGRLVGMLSMYDVFLLIRPKHTHIWGEMSDLDLRGLIDAACSRIGHILVGDVMTTDLITITPDTHLLLIIDIILKKHVRRIPVLEEGRLVGMVYMSRVFDHLLDKFVSREP